MIHIGIDTGTHTGFAVWDSEKRQLLEIATLTITQAMERVLIYRNIALETGHEIELTLRMPDCGNGTAIRGREKLQGAGAVKRDAHIWEDWCWENEINYRMVAPKDNITNWLLIHLPGVAQLQKHVSTLVDTTSALKKTRNIMNPE